MKRKGQQTLIVPLILIMMLATYAAMMPTINDLINDILGSVDSSTQALLRLIPFFMIASLLIGIVFHSTPSY